MSESFRPRSRPARWVVLTIPVVTVFCREKGLPIATTNSPGRRSAERPNGRTGSLDWRSQGEGEEQGREGGKEEREGTGKKREKEKIQEDRGATVKKRRSKDGGGVEEAKGEEG